MLRNICLSPARILILFVLDLLSFLFQRRAQTVCVINFGQSVSCIWTIAFTVNNSVLQREDFSRKNQFSATCCDSCENRLLENEDNYIYILLAALKYCLWASCMFYKALKVDVSGLTAMLLHFWISHLFVRSTIIILVSLRCLKWMRQEFNPSSLQFLGSTRVYSL